MAKASGLGARLYVGGYDLSGDTGAVGSLAGPVGVLDMTGIDKSAYERLPGQRGGMLDWTAWFNPATGQAHPVLSALPTSDTQAIYLHRATLGAPAAALACKQVNYDPQRQPDGALSFGVAAQSSAGSGLDWGLALTAGTRSDTAATDGSSVDFGAAGSYGLQAYLQVTEFTGTDITISLEQSSDDGGSDAFAAVTGGAFTEVTAGPTHERIITAGDQAVERYLRVVTSTTGGFTSCSFVVVAHVNVAPCAWGG